jgi:hypothetical protein
VRTFAEAVLIVATGACFVGAALIPDSELAAASMVAAVLLGFACSMVLLRYLVKS